MEPEESFLYVESQIVEPLHPISANPEQMNRYYTCDECHKSFTGREITLKSFSRNVTFVNPFIGITLCKESGSVITTGDTSALPDSETYYTMHCPRCGAVHLFGFDIAKKED
jgi:uncharacterized CHY-type Zn-finger protein